jgi:hypothetical protein
LSNNSIWSHVEENQRNRKEKIEEGQICHGKYSEGDKKEKEVMALSKSCFVCFSFNLFVLGCVKISRFGKKKMVVGSK